MEELQKVMKDFGPDIDRYFGSRYSAPWFLQSYQSPLPCAGVPEERVKDILTKEQLEVWDTRLLPRATNYWESIQHYHEQRLQMEKQAKEKAPPKLGWIDLNPSARDDLLVANGPSLSPHPLN